MRGRRAPMSRWENFTIWRQRLPHWRADNVDYWVTFRYRRMLEGFERRALIGALLKPEGSRWNLEILYVGAEHAHFIVSVNPGPDGRPYELSEVVERAKKKAEKVILKKTGERFGPFYGESYDRILRDDAEHEERWQAIFEEATNDPEGEDYLYVANAPD